MLYFSILKGGRNNTPTYLLNHTGPHVGVGPLLCILHRATTVAPEGKGQEPFRKVTAGHIFTLHTNEELRQGGDQVRHVVVYESTNPLWIFQQRESSSS